MRYLRGTLLIGELITLLLLSACKSYGGDIPRETSLVPNATLHIFPGYSIAVADVVMIAGVAYLVYKVTDPTAPNWEIHETRLGNNRVLYDLTMQRLHVGGDGEARQVLARRADALAREEGFSGYEIRRFEESIDSRIFLPQRTAEAEIALISKPGK